MRISEDGRLREEDPFTGTMIGDLQNRIVFHRSRFEIDLNRARDGAVYLRPEQAWGIEVWREQPSPAMVAESLAIHDAYYAMLETYLREIEERHGRFVVLDIHSYNHRRAGPDKDPTDPEAAPDINIGTHSMDRERWAPVVDAFLDVARNFDFPGRRLDVRENVAFAPDAEHPTALGFVKTAWAEAGRKLRVASGDEPVEAEVRDLPFWQELAGGGVTPRHSS